MKLTKCFCLKMCHCFKLKLRLLRQYTDTTHLVKGELRLDILWKIRSFDVLMNCDKNCLSITSMIQIKFVLVN